MISGLLAGLLLASSSSAGLAADTFDSMIVTPVVVEGQERVVALRGGDLLESGAAFRIEFLAYQAGRLTVVAQSAQGGRFLVTENRDVTAGARLRVPDAGSWFYLDDQTGLERLNITFSGAFGSETVVHAIRHVSTRFLSAEAALTGPDDPDLPSTPSADPGSSEEDAYERALIRTVRSAPDRVTAYRGALDGAARPRTSATRGILEARLYRELSAGVVLVVADDGLGTGSVIDRDGRIITNWHVVGDRETVGVIFKPPFGEEIKPSDVYIGLIQKVDPVSDLALIRVLDPPQSLTVIELGHIQDVEVGADVHAIGHPSGEGWTYTKGVISQLRPGYSWPNNQGFMHKAMVIQTQTPINPGSSGSPLITEGHKIIGINSFKKRGEALNFAVSVSDVRRFLETPGTPPPDREVGVADCKPRRDKRDTDGDGKIDRIRVDTTCDGRIDLVIVDEDSDGTSDYALADRDGDGKPDVKMVSSAKDGRFDLWLFDSDGDGRFDTIGHDRDLDGKVERYSRS